MRVLTLNIWQEQGPWQLRLEAICRQLEALAPDVVCLQEVREVPGRVPNQAATLAAASGFQHCYAAAQTWGGGEEGLAILSRLPIMAHETVELPVEGEETRRVCLAAHLKGPQDQVVSVYTTHLAYRPADGALRARQVLAVDRFIRRSSRDGVVVLAGDFNATPDSDPIRFLCGLTSLDGANTYYQDAYATTHPGSAGWTWCSENPYTEPLSWLPRDRRLDYIFVSARKRAGAGRIAACEIVCDKPEANGVRCSDHYGVQADVQIV